MSDESGSGVRTGFLLGAFAYLWWGAIPLYFSALRGHGVGAVEILAHRVAWSLPVMLVLTAVAGGWRPVRRVFASRNLFLLVAASAALLAGNWLIYIHASLTGHVTEAGLGYFMLPLANAFLGSVFLGEKLRPAHYPALAVIALGILVPLVAAGRFTWVAVSLPITFGLYGFVRKAIPVDALSGLTVESLLMLPAALGGLIYFAAVGDGHFGGDLYLDALLAASGVVTVVPLLTYVMSLRRLPLLAMNFLQFISPTTQVVIAVAVLGESPQWFEWAACGCVWAAVAVFLADAVWQYRAARRPRAVPPLVPATR